MEDAAVIRLLEAAGRAAGAGPRPRSGEIFPTYTAPVAIVRQGRIQVAPMRWGFPRPAGAGVVHNARRETALEKSLFRESLLERRALVPCSGFYEWSPIPGQRKKLRHVFRDPAGALLLMAGCWRSVPEDPDHRACFTVLTTAADTYVGPFHDRMPVLVPRKDASSWLRGPGFERFLPGAPCALSVTVLS